MPYNSLVGRSDLSTLIPVEYSNEMAQIVATESSHVMRLGRRLRDMARSEESFPVPSALATAYFLDGDTDTIQTTEVDWTNVSLYAKEAAVIVPIPKRVLDDTSMPIWPEVKTDVTAALGVLIDNAVLYGTNKPAAWPTAIVTAANAATHENSEAGFADLYDALLSDGGVFSDVEQDGFAVTGSLAHLSMKGKLRGVRDSNGQPIFSPSMQQAGAYTLDGAPCYFPTNGAGSATYRLIAGDWKQLVYSIRQDMSWSLSDQAVITDAANNIVYNLFQQDMVALKVVMRLGFALPNPINRVNPTAATRYPFATLVA